MTRLVTYFDARYAARAAVMISGAMGSNLRDVSILSLDATSKTIGENLGVGRVTSESDFLTAQPLIQSAILDRNRAEQIFSIGPSFLLSEIDLLKPGEWLVYCDADLIFLERLSDYLVPFKDASVLITPHNHYWWNKKRLSKYGEYNVGMVAFRNDANGRAALNFWARSCLEWCLDEVSEGKYADQKYLEHFASVAAKVLVDDRIGANLAPWNSMGKKITRKEDGKLEVCGETLWFFHAQGIRQSARAVTLGHLKYLALASHAVKRHIYKPYLEAIEDWSTKLEISPTAGSRASKSRARRLLAFADVALSAAFLQRIKYPIRDRT